MTNAELIQKIRDWYVGLIGGCLGHTEGEKIIIWRMERFINFLDMEKERQRRCEEEKSEIPTIKGWVARDEDGILTFTFRKPERAQNGDVGYWFGGDFLELSKEGFPDLKWANEPIEVELTISRVVK